MYHLENKTQAVLVINGLRSKDNQVKVTRPLNTVSENQPYLRNGKAHTNLKLGRLQLFCPSYTSLFFLVEVNNIFLLLGTGMKHDDRIIDVRVRADLQPESSGWLLSLQGAGAYRGVHTTGRPAACSFYCSVLSRTSVIKSFVSFFSLNFCCRLMR